MTLPILRFNPILKSAVWGGAKLTTVLGKDAPKSGPLAESWELVDLPSAQSVVHVGPHKGTSLRELIAEYTETLISSSSLMKGRFPLLFKFIDAKQTLSVQVHPDEAAAERLGGEARSKNEAWYIVDCEPGASIYVGLKDGITENVFRNAVQNDRVEACLCKTPVEVGAFYNIPAGTVHAIGAGVLLAEVQQASDTTYRVYDWGRMDTNGKPRELHVEKALASIQFEGVSLGSARSSSKYPGVETPYFHMYRMDLTPGDTARIGADKPVALMGVGGEGAATVRAGNSEENLCFGETLLVPACISGDVEMSTVENARVLVVEIP